MEDLIGKMVMMPAYNGAAWKKEVELCSWEPPLAVVRFDNSPYWGDVPEMLTRVVLTRDVSRKG